MTFLAPWFLAGLAALAVPVVVHLINRQRKTVVAFPSLMFLRKIPYRSVRRQKLRHLLLFALRCLVLALLVAAFARPFFDRRAAAAAAATGARERVILLDRSYSMSYGARWTDAVAAARRAVSEMGGNDRATLVLFARDAAAATEPTGSRPQLERAIAAAAPGDGATRYGPAIALASRMLEGSNLPRHEVLIISDFQRSGWVRQDEVRVPPGTTVTTVDVARGDTPDLAVAQATADRDRAGDLHTVTVAARVTNTGGEPRTIDATLELGGRPAATLRATVPARGAAQVRFPAVTVPGGATRGVVHIPKDALPANNAFHFTVALGDAVSVLVIEPARPRANQSLFLQRALGIGDQPTFRVDVRRADAVNPGDLANRAIVVLNEVSLPVGSVGARLRQMVDAGAGLLVVAGDVRGDRPPAEWLPALPVRLGPVVDRTRDAGGSVAQVDYGHPAFEQFSAPRSGDFSTAHVFRYRALRETGASAVVARFDDGAPAVVEHRLGRGKVVFWASSIDEYWTDLPLQPVFLPFVHELARHLARFRDSRSSYLVDEPLDLSRHGELTAMFNRTGDGGELVLQAPSGSRSVIPLSGPRQLAELHEAGFYELRGTNTAVGSGRPIAVNVDLAESDLSHFDPAELVAAVTAPAAGSTASAVGTTALPEDVERRQAVWWYLLMAALVCAGAESVLANRLSSRGNVVNAGLGSGP